MQVVIVQKPAADDLILLAGGKLHNFPRIIIPPRWHEVLVVNVLEPDQFGLKFGFVDDHVSKL